jgi:hypothetical protein
VQQSVKKSFCLPPYAIDFATSRAKGDNGIEEFISYINMIKGRENVAQTLLGETHEMDNVVGYVDILRCELDNDAESFSNSCAGWLIFLQHLGNKLSVGVFL